MYFVGLAEAGQEVFIGRLAPTGRLMMGCLGICGWQIDILFVGGTPQLRPYETVPFVPEAFSDASAGFEPTCGVPSLYFRA